MSIPIEERVQLGLKYLDETFEDWIIVFREEDLDLEINSSNLHILARVSGYDFNMSHRTYFDDGQEQWLFDKGFYPIATDEYSQEFKDEIDALNEEWKTQVEMRRMQRKFNSPINPITVHNPEEQGDLFNETD